MASPHRSLDSERGLRRGGFVERGAQAACAVLCVDSMARELALGMHVVACAALRERASHRKRGVYEL
jgi:hypothetical protein